MQYRHQTQVLTIIAQYRYSIMLVRSLGDWSRAVNDVALAVETSARHARNHIAVHRQGDWALTMDGSIHENNRRGNASEVLAHVGIPLTEWAPGVWNPITLAAIGGLFVQWATTGSAIWFAYVTPTAGLG